MEGLRYIFDQVGEKTDLKKCSACLAATCFSCMDDYCTALEKVPSGLCVFYKDAEENQKEIRRCFYRLVRYERFDLLEKYAGTLDALGLMDREVKTAAWKHHEMEKYRAWHLKHLWKTGWKDKLEIFKPAETDETQEMEEPQNDEEAVEIQEETTQEFDSSLDNEEFPDGINTDAEAVEDIGTNSAALEAEIQDDRFGIDEIMEAMGEENSIGDSLDEYAEDFTEEERLTYEERIEKAEEAELLHEAQAEKTALNKEMEQQRITDEQESYVEVPLIFVYKRVGFPIKRKRPLDPVTKAYSILGANIIYKAAEDYILTLRLLWSGEYTGHALHQLIVQKWRLESWIGSSPYWNYTDVSANRILSKCWATAEEQAKEKIERANRRIVAGIKEE